MTQYHHFEYDSVDLHDHTVRLSYTLPDDDLDDGPNVATMVIDLDAVMAFFIHHADDAYSTTIMLVGHTIMVTTDYPHLRNLLFSALDEGVSR